MAKRYQGGILGVGFNPLQAPNAPTIGTATKGNAIASVTFTDLLTSEVRLLAAMQCKAIPVPLVRWVLRLQSPCLV